MAEQQKSNNQQTASTASPDGETPIDESIRKTGDAEKSDAKSTATPEAPENDGVAGSPNQGTESR
ncbi:hypothetical protein ANSO36C_17850 [Nostoc cf. commune SO-36]|uniref:Uncharacterized protein n=1 Tax=Nostoc cf. commune SO-36 TaxID=449208 RepID=A0ABM7YZ63_NOSCO|nr:hypothetical protein [Nostoc commune]BDI15983.1 hypothetical protein ANSO36C_17850 [Nostoc cf. commune SO-36]